MKISEKKASELTKLPRSTIQRFRDIPGKIKILNPEKVEKDGLFEKVTYYYYDEVEMEKLWLIRLFKSLGKSKSEIIKQMTNPKFNKRKFLEETIDELLTLINVAKGYMNTGIGYETLSSFGIDEEASIDVINEYINIGNIISQKADELIEMKEYEPSTEWEKLFDDLYDLFNDNAIHSDQIVQDRLEKFTNEYFDNTYYSNNILQSIGVFFKKGIEMDEEFDEELLHLSDFIINAINYYNDNRIHKNEKIKLDISVSFNNFEKLAYSKYTTASSEILREVENIALNIYYTFYKNWEFTIDMLNVLSEWYDSEETRMKYDNGLEKGIFHFTSVAFKNYILKKKGKIND